MAALKISTFGGEVPRLLARDLPPSAAQISSNLLASSNEFRPLQSDTLITSAVSGAKTLFRFSRNTAGVVRTSEAEGWTTDAADVSYVRGQLADDATERTYYTHNTGTNPPGSIDCTGSGSRLLGVPPPAKPVCTLNAVTQFTMEQANTWLVGTLMPAVKKAVTESLLEDQNASRYTGAGVSQLFGLATPSYPTSQRGVTEPWNLLFPMPSDYAASRMLDDPRLGGVVVGSQLWLAIAALPYWGIIHSSTIPTLTAKLRLILNPKTGAQLWTDAQLPTVANDLVAIFDPTASAVKTKSTALDAAVKDFKTALDFVLSATTTKPTAPTKPTVPEYTTSGGDSGTTTRNAEWVTYDTALATYETALTTYNNSVSTQDAQKSARVSQMVAAQGLALSLVRDIEALYAAKKTSLEATVQTYLNNKGLVQSTTNPGGLVAVDADRIVDTRFYVVTFVTDRDEESAPSPVSAMLEVDQNDAVTITRPTLPTGRFVNRWRLYRSNVGSSTTAFQFVTEALSSVASYKDELKGAQLGEVCPTVTWAEPPTRTDSSGVLKGSDPYLKGLVGMANGVMAGFIDNYVAFCEPYTGYAWPVEYQIPLKFDIVGLAAFGQTLFVGTTGKPSLISGSDSGSMSEIQLDESQACVSRRSLVATQGGAFYASPDGLCFASQGGVQVISVGLFSREDWLALDPSSIIGFAHDGIYYFSYTGSGGGCYALDMAAKKLCRLDLRFTAVCDDLLSDGLFFVNNGGVYRALSSGRRTGQYRTPKVDIQAQQPMAWLKVMGEQSAGTPVTVKWYGDGVLRHTATVTNIEPQRLPAGRYLEHELEISSAARITSVVVAGTTEELKGS